MNAPMIQENDWRNIKFEFQIVDEEKIKPNIKE